MKNIWLILLALITVFAIAYFSLSPKVVKKQVSQKNKNILGPIIVEMVTVRDKSLGMHRSGGSVQIPNTEGYSRIVGNEFLNAVDNPLSTFSIDVDTASYSNVRRFIRDGRLPPVDAVRTEEFVNYFRYEYPKYKKLEVPFSINMEFSRAPWNSSNYLVQIGLQAKELSEKNLPSSNLVFLIDVSGSMADSNKLPLLKQAFKVLTKILKKTDTVSIVTYAGAAKIWLPPTSCSQKEIILKSIADLDAGGSTAGEQGIQMAYALAKENFILKGNNRILLATDGDFNIGPSSEGQLSRLIEQKREEGVFLSVLGFGFGNYKDDRMEMLADKGNGNYAYIDNLLEAKKVLGKEAMGFLYTLAKDVKLQVEFNPAKVRSYRLIGYENRLMKKEDFKNDDRDAGELGVGQAVTALYEIVPLKPTERPEKEIPLKYQDSIPKKASSMSEEYLTLKVRYKLPKEDTSKLLVNTLEEEHLVTFENSTSRFKFAAAVAGFAELLRGSSFLGNFKFDDIKALAVSNKGADKQGHRGELIKLIESAKILAEIN